jgi:hypothetical protein
VGICGYSAFSKTRYSAGFFNRRAVDDLFGEVEMETALEKKQGDLEAEKARREKITRYKAVAQAAKDARDAAQAAYTTAIKSGAAAAAVKAARDELTQATAAWKTAEKELADVVGPPGQSEQVLDPSGKVIDTRDKRFVLFMNANSDALAQAIQRIAEEEATVRNIAAIANADVSRQVVANDSQVETSLIVSRVIVQGLDNGLKRIEQTGYDERASAQSDLLEMINSITAFYGSARLETIEEARIWIQQNKPRIIARASGIGGAR